MLTLHVSQVPRPGVRRQQQNTERHDDEAAAWKNRTWFSGVGGESGESGRPRIPEKRRKRRRRPGDVPAAVCGAEEEADERLFPGYILVEMEKDSETINFVAATPKVLKFLGGQHDPASLTRKEIDRILGQVKGDVVVASAQKTDLNEGGEIEISEGPFAGFVGIIEKVDEENERLTVMVSIFGRLTPVELTFDQIKKIRA